MKGDLTVENLTLSTVQEVRNLQKSKYIFTLCTCLFMFQTVINFHLQNNSEPLSIKVLTLKRWAPNRDVPEDASVVLLAVTEVDIINKSSNAIVTVVCS